MHTLTWLGIALILIGIALVLLPVLGEHLKEFHIPWWLLYVYRSDGFYFVTSPLLLALSAVSLFLYFWTR
jgi:hypothetical protein